MDRLGEQISLKIGLPLFGIPTEEKQSKAPVVPTREHTVDDGYEFAALFSGLG